MVPSQQTWPWRKSGSTSVPHKRPPTWRLELSRLPSPSQRPPCHPARVAALTAPHPLPSPRKPPSSCPCQRSVPGRNRLRRLWPFQIRAAGIPSSNCPAFSPGTPVRSQNESRTAPPVNALDLSVKDACPAHPTMPPSASWSEGDFLKLRWAQPLQQTRRCYSSATSSQTAFKEHTGSLISTAKRPARCPRTECPIGGRSFSPQSASTTCHRMESN